MKPENLIIDFPSTKTYLNTNTTALLKKVIDTQDKQRQKIEMLEAANRELRKEVLELKVKLQIMEVPKQVA